MRRSCPNCEACLAHTDPQSLRRLPEPTTMKLVKPVEVKKKSRKKATVKITPKKTVRKLPKPQQVAKPKKKTKVKTKAKRSKKIKGGDVEAIPELLA